MAMNDVELAIAVVREGAEVVRRQFGIARKQVQKGPRDFATTADVEAEEAMVAILRRERPADAVIGEECGSVGAAGAPRAWLLDPLCGTLNYFAGTRIVAVNAALNTPDGVVAAAVADPFTSDVFWTDGESAYVRSGERDIPARPTSDSGLVEFNFDPPFPNGPWFRAIRLAADEKFTARFSPRVVSSSLALTWVAAGQRAAFVTDGEIRANLDFSAGLAICQAAGCPASDLYGDCWDRPAGGLIVAADQETHATLVELARKQRA
jgi:myo-inositol-1(or 4)-monophosphatase